MLSPRCEEHANSSDRTALSTGTEAEVESVPKTVSNSYIEFIKVGRSTAVILGSKSIAAM